MAPTRLQEAMGRKKSLDSTQAAKPQRQRSTNRNKPFLTKEAKIEKGAIVSTPAAAMAPPHPPPAALPAAQYVQQFLTAALSQRGPAALPYAEDVKWHIRQHLVALAESFPSLRPRSASFTHNDGRSSHLLQAEGTIPISFRGAVYHLPAAVWLLESYPRRPPAFYLTPTRDMLIKPGHPLVDPSGLVREGAIPYLRSWVFPTSNLVDLVRSLSHLFGIDPPLYTRPSNTTPSPTPSPAPAPAPSSSVSLSSPYGIGSGVARFPPPPSSLASTPSRPIEDPAEVFRRNAVPKILESVHADMAALRRSQEAEVEGLFSTQAELRRRKEELARGLQEMIEEKEGLEQQLQLILMNTDLLDGWARENEELCLRCRDGVDGDNALEPVDALSRQMLECTAGDLAIEDTIYELDKALQEGAVKFDAYLRSVRALSREQFFHRATAAKVRATLVQAQVTSMAARASHYSS